MAQFMLFMHGNPEAYANFTPDQAQQSIVAYRSWVGELAGSGKLVGAEQLKSDGGKVLSMQNGQVMVDGPYAETKEVIGGYFTVTATDYTEAIELAKGCPIFNEGGRLVIREIQPQH